VRDVLELVDAAVEARVLVFGSLPPEARDLDLLVHAREQDAVSARLGAEGFARAGTGFVRFRACTAEVVELIPAAECGLPEQELDVLLAEATPLDGLAHVVAPSPAYVLLLLALRTARGWGALKEKHRARIAAALAEDPHAWTRARGRSGAWRVTAAIEEIERRYSEREPLAPRGASRPRGRAIELSGHDSADTADQGRALRDALDRLGFDAVFEPAREGRLGGLGQLLRVRRHLRAGRTVVHERPAQPLVRRLSPTPLRAFPVDGRRPREELCAEIAAETWYALRRR
jgi:hypothetical protein